MSNTNNTAIVRTSNIGRAWHPETRRLEVTIDHDGRHFTTRDGAEPVRLVGDFVALCGYQALLADAQADDDSDAGSYYAVSVTERAHAAMVAGKRAHGAVRGDIGRTLATMRQLNRR